MCEFSVLIEAFIREKQETKGINFCVSSWLDSASKRASQISVVTHVLKYAHGDAKGTNIYAKKGAVQSKYIARYVSTDSLSNMREDVVGNAAAMDIAGLLFLKVGDVTFLDLISRDDPSPLASFAGNETQLMSWMHGFKSILSDRELSSHSLAKQIYFPSDKDEYHLLAPLYATSLSHALYERIKEDRFGEKAKEARDLKRKEKYSNTTVIDYPNLAIQTFGGTKPQNISRLNSLRGGKSFLLKSAPPVWESIRKPPIEKNAFWKSYQRNSISIMKNFKKYLGQIKDRESNKDIRNKVRNYIDQLIELMLVIAAEVQSMESGWSKTSKLLIHEQLWLDPFRDDFKEIRSQYDWRVSVANDFATLISRKIEDKDTPFSEMDNKELCSLCLEALKGCE